MTEGVDPAVLQPAVELVSLFGTKATGLAILFGVASLGFAVAQWLRLPVIPLLLVAGVAIGLVVPGASHGEAAESILGLGTSLMKLLRNIIRLESME